LAFSLLPWNSLKCSVKANHIGLIFSFGFKSLIKNLKNLIDWLLAFPKMAEITALAFT